MKIYLIIFLSACYLSSPARSSNNTANEKVALQFITAINSHNIDQLGVLMTDDHTFIDARNNSVKGREKMLQGWKGYFEWFPDYKIEAEKIISDKDTLAIFGFAEGTFHGLKQDSNAHWRLPASWKAVVTGNKISVWQVYADTKLPFQIIERYTSTPADDYKVLGFGGVFFKSKSPKQLREWYDKHLGTQLVANGYQIFQWRDKGNKEQIGSTTFGVFKDSSSYFDPSKSPFMLNFRVHNLEAFLDRLKKEGVKVFDKTESFDYGKFGWIMDLDGNKIELWEPRNEVLLDK